MSEIEVEPVITETYVITAYTVGDDYTPSHGITASGERVKAGYTVACPPDLPFGTVLRIEGLGEFDGYGDVRVCTDRGGWIRGRRLDVYMTDIQSAISFGRRTMEVEIIK